MVLKCMVLVLKRAKAVLNVTIVRTNPTAFIPFSDGPEKCTGRTLAMVELRVINITALMMPYLDMKFAEGFDVSTWHDKLVDWYVMAVGDLPVVLTPRAHIPR